MVRPGEERAGGRLATPADRRYTLGREDDSLGYRYLCEPATVILP